MYHFLVREDQSAVAVFIVGFCIEVLDILNYLCKTRKVNLDHSYCLQYSNTVKKINVPCLCLRIQTLLLPPQTQR